MPTSLPQIDSFGRPDRFMMEIQGSLLEALGVNLYSSIGKCLVEFAANAFDSDSPTIQITIPFNKIKSARDVIRDKAKRIAEQKAEEELAAAKVPKKKPLVILDPLPDDIVIQIVDHGHGMRADEIQKKFLALNRNRRIGGDEDESEKLQKTESGKRRVMGRKGLGKLAAFGVAQRVTIYSKRASDTYATEFTMDFDVIRKSPRLQDVPFIPKYHDNLDPAAHGTTITLSRLRCDAVATGEAGVASVIKDNFFGIDASEFDIQLNGNTLPDEQAEYEFVYPPGCTENTFEEEVIEVPDGLGSFKVQYNMKFRAPLNGKRNSLPANKRGARFYCNGRLAAGPSLLDLHSGVHNFQATAYLEVIVKADELDALGVDLINTNRTDFRRDNEIVTALLSRITELMALSLSAHSKFRDDTVERDLTTSPIGKVLEAQIAQLPRRTQSPAKKLIRLLARHDGVDSLSFASTAPLVIQSMNSGDVLVKLLELTQRDTSIREVVMELHRLAEIERSDALKLYRARRNALLALQKLINKSDDTWKKNQQFEGELHELLDEAPWLIEEEMGRYVSSDQTMATTLKRLEGELKINQTLGALDESLRPDQVFLMGDSTELSTIVVIELKSPNIPLKVEHWTQLEGYINQIEVFLEGEMTKKVRVRGILIGTPPPKSTRNLSESHFLKKWSDQKSVAEQIRVLTPTDLLENSLAKNAAQLAILDKDDADNASD